MKLIENYLPDEMHKGICDIIWGRNFTWLNETTDINDNNNIYCPKVIDFNAKVKQQHYLFTLEPEKRFSPFFDQVMFPIMGKLEFTSIQRAWVYNYFYYPERTKYVFHTDERYPHTVYLYNLNTCDGYTEFESGEKFSSKANSMLVFDGSKKHRPVTQTDSPMRTNINIVVLNV